MNLEFKTIAFVLAVAVPVSASIFAESEKPREIIEPPQYTAGSDALTSLVADWSARFKRLYPDTNLRIQNMDSNKDATTLDEGVVHIGPLSREADNREPRIARSGFGYEPVKVKVAIEAPNSNVSAGGALYVYINKHPEQSSPELESRFLKLVLSRLGQDMAATRGFVPMPESMAYEELEKLL